MREDLLNMRGFDELESAALDERNIAALELEFEIERMKACAEHHGDVVQREAVFAQFQDSLSDETRLRVLVWRAHQNRIELTLAPREKNLGVLLFGRRDHVVGNVEDA